MITTILISAVITRYAGLKAKCAENTVFSSPYSYRMMSKAIIEINSNLHITVPDTGKTETRHLLACFYVILHRRFTCVVAVERMRNQVCEVYFC